MTDKRQKAAKVKCKWHESLTKQSIFVEYSLLQKKHKVSFAGAHSQMNTTLFFFLFSFLFSFLFLFVRLNKFAFGTPWLTDFLCKLWFTSSVWHWVAVVPLCETSLSGEERGETSAVRRLILKVCFDNLSHYLQGSWRRCGVTETGTNGRVWWCSAQERAWV